MLHLIPAPLHRLLLRVAQRVRMRLRAWLKPRIAGVSLIALDPEERVLLVRHSYGYPGWSLPGGGLRRGKDPEATVRREIREELGCEIADLHPIEVFRDTVMGAPHTSHLFVGRLAGEAKPDGREVIEACYFPLHALPPDTGAHARRRIAHFRALGGGGADADL